MKVDVEDGDLLSGIGVGKPGTSEDALPIIAADILAEDSAARRIVAWTGAAIVTAAGTVIVLAGIWLERRRSYTVSAKGAATRIVVRSVARNPGG